MARLPDLMKLKEKWGLKLISIASLIEYRHQRDQLIEKLSESDFKTKSGVFRLHAFRSVLDHRMHYALTIGNPSADSSALVRVQTADVLVDALGLIKGESSSNFIEKTLSALSREGSGVLLYMEPRRPDLQDSSKKPRDPDSLDHPKMDFRDYGIGAQILVALGLKKLKLLSRDHRKVVGLEGYGLEISDRILFSELS